jgi:hypothetical protein
VPEIGPQEHQATIDHAEQPIDLGTGLYHKADMVVITYPHALFGRNGPHGVDGTHELFVLLADMLSSGLATAAVWMRVFPEAVTKSSPWQDTYISVRPASR